MMNILSSKLNTDSIVTSITKSRLDAIIEKVVTEKGWLSAFKNIIASTILPAFLVYKLLLKFKGDEKKIQEKIMKITSKLIEKLEKYNLTSQYNELIKDIQVSHPKLIVKILRRFGSDIGAARNYILNIAFLGTSRALEEQVVEQYPNFESIYETLLRKGISVPAALVLNLLIKFAGSITKVVEALTGMKSPTILNELFNQGINLITSLGENILGGEDSTSRSQVEDEVFVKKLVEGNKFLISNGFTEAKENIQVLKKFGGDFVQALKYLVIRSVKTTVSEDTLRDTQRDVTSIPSYYSSNFYNPAYGTTSFGRSGFYPEYSNQMPIPSARYLSNASTVIPTAYNTLQRGDAADFRSKELSKNELENVMKNLMKILVTVSNQISTSNPSTSISGVDSSLGSEMLRDIQKSSMNSVSDPDVEIMMDKMDQKMKL